MELSITLRCLIAPHNSEWNYRNYVIKQLWFLVEMTLELSILISLLAIESISPSKIIVAAFPMRFAIPQQSTKRPINFYFNRPLIRKKNFTSVYKYLHVVFTYAKGKRVSLPKKKWKKRISNVCLCITDGINIAIYARFTSICLSLFPLLLAFFQARGTQSIYLYIWRRGIYWFFSLSLGLLEEIAPQLDRHRISRHAFYTTANLATQQTHRRRARALFRNSRTVPRRTYKFSHRRRPTLMCFRVCQLLRDAVHTFQKLSSTKSHIYSLFNYSSSANVRKNLEFWYFYGVE